MAKKSGNINKIGSIELMLEEVRSAISRCTAYEKSVYEAMCSEADGWKMRLEELESEDNTE